MEKNLVDMILENGYKEFNKPQFNLGCDMFFQKKVKDDKGIKYFISIYYYKHLLEVGQDDIEVKVNWALPKLNGEGDFCQIDMLFYCLSQNGYEIKELEKRIEDFWKTNNIPYYGLWEEGEING